MTKRKAVGWEIEKEWKHQESWLTSYESESNFFLAFWSESIYGIMTNLYLSSCVQTRSDTKRGSEWRCKLKFNGLEKSVGPNIRPHGDTRWNVRCSGNFSNFPSKCSPNYVKRFRFEISREIKRFIKVNFKKSRTCVWKSIYLELLSPNRAFKKQFQAEVGFGSPEIRAT